MVITLHSVQIHYRIGPGSRLSPLPHSQIGMRARGQGYKSALEQRLGLPEVYGSSGEEQEPKAARWRRLSVGYRP